MIDEDKEEHQEAYKEGNVTSERADLSGIVCSDLELHSLALERHRVRNILKPEVEIDFLIDLILELQECDELITLSLSLDSEHDIVSSVIG
jgi:hypothetical protein